MTRDGCRAESTSGSTGQVPQSDDPLYKQAPAAPQPYPTAQPAPARPIRPRPADSKRVASYVLSHHVGVMRAGQANEKGPAARRRPKAAREPYSLYGERAAEGANEADGPFSFSCP